jgi:hypothetical protein
MQIFLGQAPPIVWWGILALLLATAAAIVLRAYTKLIETRGNKEVALAALQTISDNSNPRGSAAILDLGCLCNYINSTSEKGANHPWRHRHGHDND